MYFDQSSQSRNAFHLLVVILVGHVGIFWFISQSWVLEHVIDLVIEVHFQFIRKSL